MSEHSFDVIVIGAGPAGEVAAGRLGEAGLKVALVERELVGGECSFYACMPSKALLRPGQILDEARRVGGAAEAIGDVRPDVAATLKRRDEVVHDLDDSAQLPWIEERGIALFRGQGRLDGPRRVTVDDDVLTATKAVVLAPGSGASIPPIPGLTELEPWTNRTGTTGHEIPERLLIVGAGPVGCELAQAYRSLGSAVTVVEGTEHLLAREEAFAGETLAKAFEEQGIVVRLEAKVESARRDESGDVVLTLHGGEELRGDEVLVAAGRRPHTDDLGLETVGLEPGRTIDVGDDLRVAGHDWLFAVGDANGRILLTHMGKYQARIVADAIQGIARPLRSDGGQSPRVCFTEPQVASVGHTLDSAIEAGLDAICVDADMSQTAGGSFIGRGVDGVTRLVVERGTERVLGATFVAIDAAESLHAATLAVIGGLTIDDLWHSVPAFPTRSEVWLRLVEAWERDERR